MLVFLLVLVVLLQRRCWYGYGWYSGYPYYRGFGPYGPSYHGYYWNGYAWQPAYHAGNPYPYGVYRHPYWR